MNTAMTNNLRRCALILFQSPVEVGPSAMRGLLMSQPITPNTSTSSDASELTVSESSQLIVQQQNIQQAIVIPQPVRPPLKLQATMTLLIFLAIFGIGIATNPEGRAWFM